MQDRPSAGEILATIGEYLDQDVLPSVEGALRYHTLVAANLIAVLGRELDAGDGPARGERRDLVELLADRTEPSDSLATDLLRLNTELQARLLADELPERQFLVAARDALERSVREKLMVNKPGYDRYDMAAEVD